MRVGILTFHRSHNYGAVLQCYALKSVLTRMGHYACVIDYYPKYAKEKYKIIKFNFFRGFLVLVLTLTRKIIRHYRFNRFIKQRLSPVNTECDVYVIGSDQVWNTKLTNGFDRVFWGGFDGRKISYAASMEKTILTEPERKMIRMYLKNFDRISVRENSVVQLLSPLTNKKIYHVLDPVLLYGNGCEEIAVKPNSKRYVLVYTIRSSPSVMKIAKDIARQTGRRLVQLSSTVSPRFKKYQCASPEQFVGLIKYADFVITTSFHGVAFSVLFKRPFYAVRLNDGNESRIESLLDSLGLSDRFIENKTEITEIDYFDVNRRLNQLRDESWEYLRSSTNG